MATKRPSPVVEPESSLFTEDRTLIDIPEKPAKNGGKNGHKNGNGKAAAAVEEPEMSLSDASEDRELEHKVTTGYTADTLRVLEGREAVRQRPAMYIGDTGPNGLHHLFFEILDNCIDEVLAGRADEVDVTINEDRSISVRDNGNGIPTGINKATGLTGVELAMTKLHGGGKFGDGGYKVSGGLHGVGLSCVNFLSEWCEAVVEQNGAKYKFRCERGVPVGGLQKAGKSDRHGTTITWYADPQIFGEYEYKPEVFITRIRNTCYLNREVKITFTDKHYGTEP